MEIDHDLDLGADRGRERLHQPRDLVDIGQGGVEVRVGDEHRLEGRSPSRPPRGRARPAALSSMRFIDRAHVAEAKMGVDAHLVAHLAAEQSPHRHAQTLAQNVPQRDLDSRNRAHADDAEPPEALASSCRAPPARCRADRGRSPAARDPRPRRRRRASSIPASPRPSRTGRARSVSTRTNTQLRISAFTTRVVIDTILTDWLPARSRRRSPAFIYRIITDIKPIKS